MKFTKSQRDQIKKLDIERREYLDQASRALIEKQKYESIQSRAAVGEFKALEKKLSALQTDLIVTPSQDIKDEIASIEETLKPSKMDWVDQRDRLGQAHSLYSVLTQKAAKKKEERERLKGELYQSTITEIDGSQMLRAMAEMHYSRDKLCGGIGDFWLRDWMTQHVFNGEKFEGSQTDIKPDHLAILDATKTGACSWEDGCGAARLNQKSEMCGITGLQPRD